jgi:LysR family cys regulon transcriptional activator
LITLQQLRCLRELARQSLSVSNAAVALDASQPNVSRQIQGLERALGVTLLVRRSNRVLAFTEVGQVVLDLATRVVNDVESIQAVADDARDEHNGKLRVATTHLHARYTLRAAIKRFAAAHPRVDFQLLQVDANGIARLVESGDAELGVSTDAPAEGTSLLLLEGDLLGRSLIVPRDHTLAGRKRVALDDLARHPFLGYNPRSRNGRIIAQAFRDHGIRVRSVMSANDSDVIKAYVEEGLGIAVIPSIALEAADRTRLVGIDVTALFPPSRMTISLRRGAYPRRYVTDFIEMLAPQWSREAVLGVRGGGDL